MDIRNYNRSAWDKLVTSGNEWTQPVSQEIISAARTGAISLLLTPKIPVPMAWYPKLAGSDVLCLASGGGQQAPVLAAAGANVVSFDNSPRQLEQDRFVAERDNLPVRTVEGDMRDLSMFPDASFDLIFHPVSNIFVPDILPVWMECYRVLRHGGVLLAGFSNPVTYIFDLNKMDEGILEVVHALPYSDMTSISAEERQNMVDKDMPLEFSHTLEEQMGGQMMAGFVLTAMFEDYDRGNVLSQYLPTFIATRALKV